MTRHLLTLFGCLALLASLFVMSPAAHAAADNDEELMAQIEELVADLDANTLAERDLAESNLISLGEIPGVGFPKLLKLIPQPTPNTPASVRKRLISIRKGIEEQISLQATEASIVSLEAIQWPLADVLQELEKLTGNKLIDNRNRDGAEANAEEVVLKVDDAPFWSVVDQVLDQANLSLAVYAGEDALSLIDREPGEVNRFGRASYSGPFRFEVVNVIATRGLRNPANQSLNLALEIAWEPRLRPIAITQQLDLLQATDDQGNPLPIGQPGRVFNIEVQEGTSASTIHAPFKLPARNIERIATLRGSLQALVPGKREKFRFDDLKSKKPIVVTRGGVQVTLERVVKNNAIWEVHMRFKLDGDDDSLASHRGWVFNNLTYLVGADGEPIDHAGFETTMQSQTEVGIAYLFDLPDGIKGLSWVYESPVSIVQRSYKFELQDIELP